MQSDQNSITKQSANTCFGGRVCSGTAKLLFECGQGPESQDFRSVILPSHHVQDTWTQETALVQVALSPLCCQGVTDRQHNSLGYDSIHTQNLQAVENDTSIQESKQAQAVRTAQHQHCRDMKTQMQVSHTTCCYCHKMPPSTLQPRLNLCWARDAPLYK